MVALDLGVDTSTSQGELMANVLASFAQFERRLIGQGTREGLAAARAKGVRLGNPNRIKGRTPEAIRQRILKRHARGVSYHDIAPSSMPTAYRRRLGACAGTPQASARSRSAPPDCAIRASNDGSKEPGLIIPAATLKSRFLCAQNRRA
jgi:hypothetical protein